MVGTKSIDISTGETVASITGRLVAIYTHLGEQSLKFLPPLFTEEQSQTPDIVYQEISNNASIHMGLANKNNTPKHLPNDGRKNDYCFWHNQKLPNGIITTPYYLRSNALLEPQYHILTPKDPKHFHSLEPSKESKRWKQLLKIISEAEGILHS